MTGWWIALAAALLAVALGLGWLLVQRRTGGPGRATELFVYAIYEQVFLDLSVGRASALTVVFFAMLLGLSALQLRAWRARGAAPQ